MLKFTTALMVFLGVCGPAGADPSWQDAVGRVNSAGYKSRSHCSGALIAPDLVLTAAHCVYGHRAARVPLDPADLIFVAGWDRGAHKGASNAVEVIVHPGFEQAQRLSGAQAVADIALLRLATPISDVSPLPVARALSSNSLTIAGYPGDRPHLLKVQTDCPRNGLDGVLSLGCAVIPGNSGGPVLQGPSDAPQIVGTVSMRWGEIAIAAPVTAATLTELLDELP